MKPLVGKDLDGLYSCLRLADQFLERAEKLASGAFGSHMLSMEIRAARRTTAFGFIFHRNRVPWLKQLAEQITPPPTPKVLRMTGGDDYGV